MATARREQSKQVTLSAIAPARSPRNLLPGILIGCSLIGVVAAQVVGPGWMRLLFCHLNLAGLSAQVALLAACAAVIVVHELGHLTAALAMKFEVLGMAIGPFRFARLHGRVTVAFSGRRALSGSISAIPLDNARWRGRMLTVIAAGPLATALAAAISLAVLLALRDGSWLQYACSAFAELNIIVLTLGFIPNGEFARTRNDAQLFWCVLRDTAEARAIRTYQQLMRLKVEGVRPRDYPLPFTQALAFGYRRPDMRLLFADALMKCAIDRHDLQAAEAWYRQAAEFMTAGRAPLDNLARAESGCFDLLFRNDAAAAKDKLFRVRLSDISPAWLRHRITAARQAAAGNKHAALLEIEKAKASLPRNIAYGDFERVLLGRLSILSA